MNGITRAFCTVLFLISIDSARAEIFIENGNNRTAIVLAQDIPDSTIVGTLDGLPITAGDVRNNFIRGNIFSGQSGFDGGLLPGRTGSNFDLDKFMGDGGIKFRTAPKPGVDYLPFQEIGSYQAEPAGKYGKFGPRWNPTPGEFIETNFPDSWDRLKQYPRQPPGSNSGFRKPCNILGTAVLLETVVVVAAEDYYRSNDSQLRDRRFANFNAAARNQSRNNMLKNLRNGSIPTGMTPEEYEAMIPGPVAHVDPFHQLTLFEWMQEKGSQVGSALTTLGGAAIKAPGKFANNISISIFGSPIW